MSWLNRIRNVFRSDALDRELDEEIQQHLDMRAADLKNSGLDADVARAQARRLLGQPLAIQERTRDMDVAGWLDTARQDLRYAWRQILESPGFTAVAVLSLALGIGANMGIFSLLNAVFLASLPVEDPASLVMLSDPESGGVAVGSSTGDRPLLTFSEYQRLEERMDTFSGMFASESNMSRYDGRVNGQGKEDVRARLVTGGYFSVLGIQPLAGRFFEPGQDGNPGRSPHAVLSYSYWQRRFAGRLSALGATIQVGTATLTVVGIAPARFSGETTGRQPDIWVPMNMEPQVKPGTDWLHEDLSKNLDKVMWLHVFGRLKPGASLAQAQAQAGIVFKNMMEADYGGNLTAEARREFLDQRLLLRPGGKGASDLRGRVGEALLVLLAVVAMVLLIACANIANLLFARAAARSREWSIRLALGAGRGRLIRQLITESFVLVLLGGVAGLAVASTTVRLLLVMMSGRPDQPLRFEAGFDWRVLAFTAGTMILTVLLCGLAPAFRITRLDVNSSLKEGVRGVTSAASRVSFAKSLVAIQVALSLLLLVGAGLFLRTLDNLKAVNLGYPKDRLVQIRIDGQAAGYQEARLLNLYREIAERIRLLPGVHSVTYSENGLFAGTDSGDRVIVEGFTPKRREDEGAAFDLIGPGYFRAVGAPMLLGREFVPDDSGAAQSYCVINDAFARRFFAGRNPIGRHLTAVFGDSRKTWEVIGVSADTRDHSLRREIPPRYYLHVERANYIPASVHFLVRSSAAQGTLPALRKAVEDVDSRIPILNARSLAELLDASVSREKLVARLSAVFGGIALLLAAIGLYGVLSYGVARRTGEIGIRMALGARRSTVVGMILRETGLLVAVGLVAGIAGALACTRLVSSLLYGVRPLEPVTIAGATGILCGVAVLAGLLPAHRASRVDPASALRAD